MMFKYQINTGNSENLEFSIIKLVFCKRGLLESLVVWPSITFMTCVPEGLVGLFHELSSVFNSCGPE